MKPIAHLGLAFASGMALLHASTAVAQTDASAGVGTLFGWSVTGSLQARVSPDYMGSKTYTVGPTGSLQFSRPGVQAVFSAPDDSPGLQLLGDRTLSAGVVVDWRSARGDHDALRGFDKIDGSIEPGAYVNWWPIEGLRLRGEVRHGFGDDSNWTADLGADAVHDHASWLLSIGPRLHLGDSKFTRTYFGVTAAEAANSPFGISPFAADGAFTSAGALASVEYRWTKRWSVLANADYSRLLGTAGDSPIVRLGSRDQLSAALGLRYAFGR